MLHDLSAPASSQTSHPKTPSWPQFLPSLICSLLPKALAFGKGPLHLWCLTGVRRSPAAQASPTTGSTWQPLCLALPALPPPSPLSLPCEPFLASLSLLEDTKLCDGQSSGHCLGNWKERCLPVHPGPPDQQSKPRRTFKASQRHIGLLCKELVV